MSYSTSDSEDAPPRNSKHEPHRINFIKENKRKLKQIASMVTHNNKYSKVDGSKSQGSQPDNASRSETPLLKHRPSRKSSGTGCRVSRKGAMAVFLQDKREIGGASTTSISNLPKVQKIVILNKNQACQTIDPRKYDQLFHEGIIKYPSNKVLQQLAEVERQKANRYDAHIKKEFMKKNKVKSRSPIPLLSRNTKGRGDEVTDEEGNEEREKEKEKEREKEREREKEKEKEREKEKEKEREKEKEKEKERERIKEKEAEKEKELEKEKAREKEKEKLREKEKEKPSSNSRQLDKSRANKMVPPRSPVRQPPPILNAADIIRKTTEDRMTYSPRENVSHRSSGFTSDRAPNNFGDIRMSRNVQPILKTNKKPPFKKISKDDNNVLKTVLDPMCPPGHIPLPDQERKKTLHMLRVSYAELVREMNLLPVRTDTLRIRQKKIQLENQLNKIEEGIKVFNKSKVYVKIEE